MRISDWSSDVCSSDLLERSRLALSPLTFDIAGGRMASDIIINARERPVATDYDIRLSPTPMGNLLAKFGVDASGTSGVRSEEHTSELQSLMRISYAVFCLKKTKQNRSHHIAHSEYEPTYSPEYTN